MKRFKIEQSTADIVSQSGDKKGQILLTPEIELEGWWTSLSVSDKKIVQLYADHGTSEQFHSEFMGFDAASK